ncbi:M23 family metallopeptidase [Microbacterium sp. G2-8]|uniref:M23 family metallopeptidase n=1 Tax=Microbacterium sp. G2-8 TaxID=2842454 RepID=UPI001C89907F|nr:M23 family metallopeptidase [Microbacterium sp. G2-8]
MTTPRWKRRVRPPRIAGAAVAVGTVVAVCSASLLGAAFLSDPAPQKAAPAEVTTLASGPSVAGAPAPGASDHAHGGVTEEDVAASAAQLMHSEYAASTKKELEQLRREAREKLIAEAKASGLPIDLDDLPALGDLRTGGRLAWPLANYWISDVFGTRGGHHMGIDLAAAGGEPIGAAAPGVVVVSSEGHFGYGVAVIIQHIDGLQTVYGHLTHGSRTVEVGDWVETGDHIGAVGNTGRSFGNHLHFELRRHGVPIDPYPLLTGGSAAPDELRPSVPAPPVPAPVPATPEKPSPESPKTPDPKPSPKPSPSPDPTPTKDPQPTPTKKPTPTPTKTPKPTPTEEPPKPTPTATPKPTPPAPTPDPEVPTPDPEEPTTTPEPEAPSPSPSQAPQQTPPAEPSQAPTEPEASETPAA